MECWEIVDYYYPPSCVQDEVSEMEEEEEEEKKSKLRWIIDAGFSLGKKLVITGVVITSAPLVLPPLVVVSALGCALSFPFGVVFASYACTQKLMSRLLPSPTTLLLPYDDDDDDKEEEEEIEAMKYGIQARIELLDYNEGLDARDGYLEVVELNEGDIGEEDGEIYENPRVDIAAKTDDYGGEMEFEGQNNLEDSRNDVNSQVEIDTSLENEGEKGISEREDVSKDHNVTVDSIAAKTDDYGGEMEFGWQNNVDNSRDDVNSPVQIDTSLEKSMSEKTRREDLLKDQNVTVESIAARTDDYGGEMGNKEQNNVGSSRNDVESSQAQIDTSLKNEGEKGVSEKTERGYLSQDQNVLVESATVATVKVIDKDKDEKRRSGKRGKRKTLASLKFHGKQKEAEEDKKPGKLPREDKRLTTQEEAKDLSANKSSLGEEQAFPEANREELGVQKEQADEEKCIVLGVGNLDVEQVSMESKRDEIVGDIESSLEKEGEPVGLKKISDVCIETNGETTTTYRSTTVAVATGSAEGTLGKVHTLHYDDEFHAVNLVDIVTVMWTNSGWSYISFYFIFIFIFCICRRFSDNRRR